MLFYGIVKIVDIGGDAFVQHDACNEDPVPIKTDFGAPFGSLNFCDLTKTEH